MTRFVMTSLIASLVLTIVLNVVVRLADRGQQPPRQPVRPPNPDRAEEHRRLRVYVPWKAMVVVSLALTVLLNLGVWLAR